MKKIKLTQGEYALVDSADYKALTQWKWQLLSSKKHSIKYAFRIVKKTKSRSRQTILMHRFLLNPPKGMVIDHKDGDGLNNQRKNLRTCSHSQNSFNRGKSKTNTSGYKGVTYYKNNKKWGAFINIKNKQHYLGLFKSKLEAYEAYCKACVKHHGEYARVV